MKHVDLYSLIMILMGCCVVEASQAPQPDTLTGSKDVPVRIMPHNALHHTLRHYPPLVAQQLDSGLTVHAVVGEHKESQQTEAVSQDTSVELAQRYDEYLAVRQHEEEIKKQAALNQKLTPFIGQLDMHHAFRQPYYREFFAELFESKQAQEETCKIQLWKNMHQDLLNWYLGDVAKAYRVLRKYFPRGICDLIILSTYGVRIHHRS